MAIGEEPPGSSLALAIGSRNDREVAGLLLPGRLFPYERRLVLVLAHFADGKDLAVHDDKDAGREQARGKQAFGKVLQTRRCPRIPEASWRRSG